MKVVELLVTIVMAVGVVVKERKTVQFNEEVQVKTVEVEPEDIIAIDEVCCTVEMVYSFVALY
jgi:hypothetical protein